MFNGIKHGVGLRQNGGILIPLFLIFSRVSFILNQFDLLDEKLKVNVGLGYLAIEVLLRRRLLRVPSLWQFFMLYIKLYKIILHDILFYYSCHRVTYNNYFRI